MENIINYVVLEEIAEADNNLNNIVEAIIPRIEGVDVLNLLELEEERECEDHVRNLNYFEDIIPRYSPQDFFEHFRMSRNVMEVLIQNIANRMGDLNYTIPVEKRILFTVWMLSKPESYKACCDRFGISKGSGHSMFYEICGKLKEMIPDEIKWPTFEESVRDANFMEEKTGFPGIIGSIDGCHIPIKAPAYNPIDYYNRKSFHSVILQAVCDSKLKFTDIFVGMPGRVHDARVFRVSPLYDRMHNQNPPLIHPDFHILGDSAYPLMNNVLVPFRDNGHLTEMQTNYNIVLSTARSKIEQAFGRLKGKFRRLKYLDVNEENVNTVVAAACVLHNFTILREEDEQIINHDIEDNQLINEEVIEDNGENINTAVQKRNVIMQQIY